MRAHQQTWLAILLARLCCLTPSHGDVYPNLFLLFQQSLVSNPIAGINSPPPPLTYLPAYADTIDFDVTVEMWWEDVTIDETKHSFTLQYWWHLEWNDSRTYDQIRDAPSQEEEPCSTVCSPITGAVLSGTGGNACCTFVYCPNSYFQNLIASDLQHHSPQWYLYAEPNSTSVHIWTRFTSTYFAKFDFTGFPFDRQALSVLAVSEYMPSLRKNGFRLLPRPALQPWLYTGPQTTVNGRTGPPFHIKGWDVIGMEAGVVGIQQKLKYVEVSELTPSNFTTPGLEFTIFIRRAKTSFYAFKVVLPPTLMCLLTAASFCLSMLNVKGRMEICAAMFLALLLLQFTIRLYVPGAQELIPPYIALIISYIYLMLFTLLYLSLGIITQSYMHFERSAKVLHARLMFNEFQQSELDSLHGVHSAKSERIFSRNHKGFEKELDKAVHKIAEQRRQLKESLRLHDQPYYAHPKSFIGAILLSSAHYRHFLTWLHFLREPKGKDLCNSVAQRLERWAVVMLLATYLVATILIYVLAATL